jgi:preprotein translocase subunit SecF
LYTSTFKLGFAKCGPHISQINILLVTYFKQSAASKINTKLYGVVIGTYSSIYVASSMILALGISKQDLLPSEKESKEIDARP